MTRLAVRRFTDADREAASALLAARHAAQRRVEPGLDPAYEDAGVARALLDTLVDRHRAEGVAAERDGRVTAFLLGASRDDVIWGPNVWVEPEGWAAEQAEDVRDLYAAAAAHWVDAGRTAHYAVVPATDPTLVDAWFRLGFGHQHVHAIRGAPDASELASPPPGLVVRRAEHGDLDALARLDLVLPEHQMRSPVFSQLPPPSLEEARRDWEESFDDERFVTFVAERDGRVVGCSIACPVEVSSLHTGLTKVPGAGLLGYAAVLADARGLGVGRALGSVALEWSRLDGREWCVTDWRMTNLPASRAWPQLGFRPTFYRLHRRI